MKIVKVIFFAIVGAIVGAFLLALIAYQLLGVPVQEDVDNVGNLVVTAYGFMFGGILGALIGLTIALLRIKKPINK